MIINTANEIFTKMEQKEVTKQPEMETCKYNPYRTEKIALK